MPIRILRFCRKCLTIRQTLTREACGVCAGELVSLLDANGAMSQEFLLARGSCCSSACRNCPYGNRDIKSLQNSGSESLKSCAKCGSGFECRDQGCWCQAARLSPATLKWLGCTYDGCLCPACLSEFASV